MLTICAQLQNCPYSPAPQHWYAADGIRVCDAVSVEAQEIRREEFRVTQLWLRLEHFGRQAGSSRAHAAGSPTGTHRYKLAACG